MKIGIVLASVLLAIIMIDFASAQTVACSASVENQTRVTVLQNGCGSYVEICSYYARPPQTATCWHSFSGCDYGYKWRTLKPSQAPFYNYNLGNASGLSSGLICMTNSSGTNLCCGSPCGYGIGFFSACQQCGYVGDHKSVNDYSSCYQSTGTCYSGTCYQSPEIILARGLNLSDRYYSALANVSIFAQLHDNVSLKTAGLTICKRGTLDCFNDTQINLTGSDFSGSLGFSDDAKMWIDENAKANSIFDVNINVSNNAGLTSETAVVLYGEDTPVVNASISSSSLNFGDKITIGASVIEQLSGIKSVNIYTDNALAMTCTSSTCSYEYVPGEGAHTYIVTAYDNAGNFNSASGSFSVANTQKTCLEIGGAICSSDEKCTNEQQVSTFDAEQCCTSSCYSAELNLTCSAQNGIVYDPSQKECSADISATDTISPNRCCAVPPMDKIIAQEESAYWTDSIGNRIFGSGIQESVICAATGTIENLQILKDGNVLSEKKSLELEIGANDPGTYICKATYTDGNEKESSLSVTEVPAPSSVVRARLPGFGIVQLIFSLIVISVYYFAKRK